jgi:hypothetical protein
MIEVPLTNRSFPTLVSDCDADVVSGRSWFAKKSRHGWYACCSIWNGGKVKTVRLHRLIMKCPDDMTVDHLNGDHWDNRRDNLEVVTSLENNLRQHLYNQEDIMRRVHGDVGGGE